MATSHTQHHSQTTLKVHINSHRLQFSYTYCTNTGYKLKHSKLSVLRMNSRKPDTSTETSRRSDSTVVYITGRKSDTQDRICLKLFCIGYSNKSRFGNSLWPKLSAMQKHSVHRYTYRQRLRTVAKHHSMNSKQLLKISSKLVTMM